MNFKDLPSDSRIWIFSADRFLSSEEQLVISNNLNEFIKNWAAHSKELFGAFELFHNNFIVIGVDESKIPASGCSIDTLTHFMKDQGKLIGIDFFNRMKLLISKGNDFKRINFSELSDYADWEVFDPTITNKTKFSANWLIPVNDFICQ